MKKILVATDYSKEARHALLFALGLAHRAKAEIVLFHAFNQPLSVADAYRLEEAIGELEKEKTRVLEDYAQEVKMEKSQDFVLRFHCPPKTPIKEIKGDHLIKAGFHIVESDGTAEHAAVKIICVCKFGLPEDSIRVAAQAYGADLVVMGMRGAGPLSQAFLGSAVAGVIQAGQVPVLALPLQATWKERPTFVLASDLAVLPDPAMLGQLRALVKLFQAQLRVLHLYRPNDPQQELQKAKLALEVLDKALYDLPYQVYFQQRQDTARGIQEFLQAQQADLLALVPKHHNFLEILLGDTITGLMTEKAIIPLLTLPYTPAIERGMTKSNKKVKRMVS
jgi:nucleotide-binding universal stress UspA family protein